MKIILMWIKCDTLAVRNWKKMLDEFTKITFNQYMNQIRIRLGGLFRLSSLHGKLVEEIILALSPYPPDVHFRHEVVDQWKQVCLLKPLRFKHKTNLLIFDWFYLKYFLLSLLIWKQYRKNNI